jgi:hypothetical protein
MFKQWLTVEDIDEAELSSWDGRRDCRRALGGFAERCLDAV